jgi:hypothetical protein
MRASWSYGRLGKRLPTFWHNVCPWLLGREVPIAWLNAYFSQRILDLGPFRDLRLKLTRRLRILLVRISIPFNASSAFTRLNIACDNGLNCAESVL